MIVINYADQRRQFGNQNFQIKSTSPGINMGDYSDFGLLQLGRFDHTLLKAGTVVKMHPHKNDEILSYMRKGVMNHTDSKGNVVGINSSYMMMMNSGSGILHEETALEDGEDVEMIQIFIRPEKDELMPRVQFYQFEEPYSVNRWRLIGGYDGSNAPLTINSKITVSDTHITKNMQVEVNKGMVGLLYVFSGDIEIKDDVLDRGDSVVTDESLEIKLLSESADLVYFEMDKEAVYSRSGRYSGMK